MIILKITARLLTGFAALCVAAAILWSGWGGPPKWTAIAPYWLALICLLVPTGLIQKSKIAVAIVFLSCFGLIAILIAYRIPLSWASVFWLLGLLAKPGLVAMAELERKRASNQASHATSEPAPRAVSSSREG